MCEHRGGKLQVDGKVSDMCGVSYYSATGENDIDYDGYVPTGLGIGGGDYIGLTICLDCKQVVNFPTLSEEDIIQALRGR